MKSKMLITGALLLFQGFAITNALAEESANPNDPCTMVLCLAGKAEGASGGSICDSAISKFFSVNSFKKHHRFNPGETLSLRRNLLKGCAGNAATVNSVLAKFGKVRG